MRIASGTPTINLTLNALTGLASPLLATFWQHDNPHRQRVRSLYDYRHAAPWVLPSWWTSRPEVAGADAQHVDRPGQQRHDGVLGCRDDGQLDAGVAGTFASLDTALFDSTATGVRNVNLTAGIYNGGGTGQQRHQPQLHVLGHGQDYGRWQPDQAGPRDADGQQQRRQRLHRRNLHPERNVGAGPHQRTAHGGDRDDPGSTGSGTLNLNGFGQTIAGLATAGTASSQTITNNGGVDATLTYAGGSSTFGGSITNGGHHTLLAVTLGLLSLVGSNSFTGATAVSGGTLSLDAATAITASPVTVSLTGVLTESVANALSGSASLTYNVTGGTLTLTQTNSYSGGRTSRTALCRPGRRQCPAGRRYRHHRQLGILDLNGNNQQIGVLAGTGTATITNSSTTANAILSCHASNYGGVINNGTKRPPPWP